MISETMKDESLRSFSDCSGARLCSHLSWGTFVHRFDDGDSVPLLQRKTIASITWSDLENDTALIRTNTQRSR